jgi:hypothetical protein
VLAGLVVLGTLLSAVLIARGRFLRQWTDADRRLAVTTAVDAMLQNWMVDPAVNVPLNSAGALPGAPGFGWTTQVLNDRIATQLGVMTVRLSVYDHRPNRAVDLSDRQFENPVLSVDFLVHPVPSEETTPARSTNTGPGQRLR